MLIMYRVQTRADVFLHDGQYRKRKQMFHTQNNIIVHGDLRLYSPGPAADKHEEFRVQVQRLRGSDL
jgi:hypothetical protein